MSHDKEEDTVHGNGMTFSTDNDFKGGRWVNGEFFYKEQRQGKTQSKHNATYGVFGSDSSGSDSDGDRGSSGDEDYGSRQNRRVNQKNRGGSQHGNKSRRKKEKTQKPMFFVAKENDVPVDSSTHVNHKNDKKDEANDDDVAIDQFQKIIDTIPQDNHTHTPVSKGVSNVEFRDILEKTNAPKPSYKPPPLTATQRDMKWEKNTKGFGKKYLSKFGFTGRLGAKETGVSGVIEVKVRPSQMGLGFGNFTEQSAMESNRKLDAEVRGKDYVPLEKNIPKDKEGGGHGKKKSRGLVEDRAASQAWKLGGISVTDATLREHGKKPETTSAGKKGKGGGGVSFGGVFGSETLATASSAHTPKQVILDMRGAVPKHITDTATINDQPDAVQEGEDMSTPSPMLGQELLYNLNLIVDMDELHLQTSTARLDSLEKRIDALAADQEELKVQAESDTTQLTALESIDSILDRMDSALSQRPLLVTRDDILRAFRKVCVYYPEETKLLGTWGRIRLGSVRL
jgi:tuftelin-interacting protein 11